MDESSAKKERPYSTGRLWFVVFAYMALEALFSYQDTSHTLRELAQFLFFGGAALAHFPKDESATPAKLQKVGFAIAFVGVLLGLWYHLGKSLG